MQQWNGGIASLVLLSALESTILLSGCSTEPQTENVEYIVDVDSVQCPATATVNEPVTINLYGTIGTSGCYSFSRFETRKQSMQLDLTVWGIFNRTGPPYPYCPTVMVYLGGMPFTFQPPERGNFTIVIHNHDGTVLRDSLQVN